MAEVGQHVVMDAARLSRIGDMRRTFQLLRQRVDPNPGASLHLANGQAAKTLQPGHQLHALDQRSPGQRLQKLLARSAAEFWQVRVDDYAPADGECGRASADRETVPGQ